MLVLSKWQANTYANPICYYLLLTKISFHFLPKNKKMSFHFISFHSIPLKEIQKDQKDVS